MAILQLGKFDHICTFLFIELENWIKHILNKKIKAGKVKIRIGNKAVDHTPLEFVQDHLVMKLL